jgi:very-short-patch-repair endonuclease
VWTTPDTKTARSDIISAVNWADIAAAQAGVVGRRQLRQAGLSADAVDRLIRGGGLTGIHRGVFLVRGAPLTYRASLWAAVLATRGTLGFQTAAHLWGVVDSDDGPTQLVVAPSRRLSPIAGTRVRRCFVPASVCTQRDGLPITTRAWTVLDVLGTLGLSKAQALADRGLQRGWITPDDVRRRLTDYPGHAGNRMLRRLATQLDDGAAAASERRLHRILRRAGIAGWLPNYPLWVNGTLVAVIDVAIVAARVAIEVDGWAFHSDVARFQRDRTRQNALTAAGWITLRFTWADLTQRPAYVGQQIRGQVAVRRDFGAFAAL